MAAGVLSACRPAQVARTPEALEHERLKQADPDHALPRPPLLSAVDERQVGRALVAAVDPPGGTVTLRHARQGPDDWPEMNLTFRASRPLLARLKAGDAVAFTLRATDGGGEILELRTLP